MNAHRIALVTGRVGHHAGHSGYDHLAYSAAREFADGVDVLRPTRMPVTVRGPWGNALVRKVGRRWYGHESLAMELAATRRFLPRSDTSAVHLLWGDQAFAWSGFVPRGGRRMSATFHQPPSLLTELGLSQRVLRTLNGIVILSETQRDFFAARVGDERVHLIPHGVDTEFFRPGGSERQRTCLVVGQWLRDVDLLVRTAELFSAADRSVQIRLVGASAEIRARTLHLDNVVCLPRITDEELLREYQRCGVFLMPVTDATANCALLEALSCGCPIVASDTGGIAEYLPNGSSTLIHDATEMCEAALSLLGEPAAAKAFGISARERAIQFDWAHISRELIRVIASLSGTAKGESGRVS